MAVAEFVGFKKRAYTPDLEPHKPKPKTLHSKPLTLNLQPQADSMSSTFGAFPETLSWLLNIFHLCE